MKQWTGVTFVKLLALGAFVGMAFVFAQPKEFVATEADFADIEKWTKVGEFKGPSQALGAAHEGSNETVTRVVFIKDDARRANGQFPVGTIIAKQHRAADGKIMGITVMAKRGAEFNKDFGGWEWFMLDPASRKIAVGADGKDVRGAIAMCNSCHVQAKDKDFVFTR